MQKLSRKNWIELSVMTVVFVIAAFLVYKTTILTRMMLPRLTSLVKEEEGKQYLLLDGDHLEQTFLYPEDELLSAGIEVSLDEKELIRLREEEDQEEFGTLRIQVLDESNSPIMEADYKVDDLADGQNLIASFPQAQAGWADRKLTIVLDAVQLEEKADLAIGYSTKNVSHADLIINGEAADFTLNIKTASHQFLYWKQWSMFGAALVYLLLLGTYLGLAVFRVRVERVFLFAGSLLAILYLLLMPPMTVPDEYAHYKEAYYHANRLLGKQNAGNDVVMELEDYNATQQFLYTPSLTEFDDLKENILKKGRQEGETELISRYTQAPAVTYIHGIIGIVLGRLLGLNGLLVIYMGRICAILFYLAAMYWFIRLMPFAKSLAFILAILPMTIQQCCSYSYDAIIIEVVFLYTAVLFGLLYKRETIHKWQIVLYVVFMVILSICKGGAYMPLCLLTMMIPASRFRDKKRKWIFVGSMAAIAIAAFLSSTLSYVLYVAAPTEEQAAASYLAGEAYGLAGLLSDPINFICLSARTLFLSGDGFLETMIGMQLGWLNIFVSRIVIYGLFLLMLLSILPVEDGRERQEIVVTAWQKAAFLFVAGISVAMTFASMFMSWTPKDSTEIAGIQGRYFLPLLPVFLMLFHSREITIKKDRGNRYIFLAVSLQCVAIYGILMSLERIL